MQTAQQPQAKTAWEAKAQTLLDSQATAMAAIIHSKSDAEFSDATQQFDRVHADIKRHALEGLAEIDAQIAAGKSVADMLAAAKTLSTQAGQIKTAIEQANSVAQFIGQLTSLATNVIHLF